MMRKNKKAWLRILEAFIAIILITGVLLVLYTRTIKKPAIGEEIYKFQKNILDEIASMPTLREDVLKGVESNVEIFAEKRTPPSFNVAVEICEVDEICELSEYMGREGKDIYSTERIISSTIQMQDFEPKKLKVFMWAK